MDYTAKGRFELIDICILRGFRGIAKKTKRELVSLLESADREMADLRLLRQRRRDAAKREAEERQMRVATTVAANPTFAASIRRAIFHGFPQYPILTAVLIAAQKFESAEATLSATHKPQYYIEEHELFPAHYITSPHYCHIQNALHKPQDD